MARQMFSVVAGLMRGRRGEEVVTVPPPESPDAAAPPAHDPLMDPLRAAVEDALIEAGYLDDPLLKPSPSRVDGVGDA